LNSRVKVRRFMRQISLVLAVSLQPDTDYLT
jgi:hypothetical protein